MAMRAGHCEKQPLFEALKEGYSVVRIPGLLVTERGTVLASGEARRGRGRDWDDNDVVLRRSADGGRSWEPLRTILRCADYGPGPISNFVMISDPATGVVHAIFCHSYARVFHMKSVNEGETFGAPVEITGALEGYRADYPWRVAATGPGHGLQLRAGRFIVPVWMSDGTGTEFGPGKLGHRPSIVGVIYSDDHGATWRRGAVVAWTDARFRHPNETAAVELADGRVLFNMRTECGEHRRLISISPDGATGWSDPAFDPALLDPVCMASLLRISWPGEGRSRVLFANPHTLDDTQRGPGNSWRIARDRKNLSVKLSYDECRTWPVNKTLEAGPSGYSDLALCRDGEVLCLYECGVADGRTLMLARFNLEWLTDGADSLDKKAPR